MNNLYKSIKGAIVKLSLVSILLCLVCAPIYAQKTTSIIIIPKSSGVTIPKEIYGQFAEHLGTGIYGGIWVGKDSPIPNTDGYRNDVLQALRALEVPVIRWPGGCFADYYHWKDGIGPQSSRPSIINALWGGTIEDNSFGTHEFLNLCELIGCEPYISANVGSGSVQEMAQWVDYMTAPSGPMAELRAQNGRKEPWDVKYIGVGNESWGCGGQMTPEYYSNLYRQYAEFCRKMGGRPLYKVACGASDYDYNWTEVLMQGVGRRMDGISLHYYTVNWDDKGYATGFSSDKYYWSVAKCLGIEPVLIKHIEIMDKYDPSGKIGLLVDEWGTWWDQEPGSVEGHLYQQNSMRDAIVASLSLDLFHRYTKRVKMTNIAQMVNVLQSMILTKDEKMVLTPTYHIFEMYKVHHNSELVELDIATDTLDIAQPASGSLTSIPAVSATASRNASGTIHISMTNISLTETQSITIKTTCQRFIDGTILTSAKIDDCNTFETPNNVVPAKFTDAKMKNGTLRLKLPPHSVVTIAIED